MNNLDKATDAFVAVLLETEEYQNYARELARVKQYPELKAQIDDFRKRNYEMQASGNIDFAGIDRFEAEYQTIRENPMVADFLAAEVDFCKMMQEVNLRITAAFEFE